MREEYVVHIPTPVAKAVMKIPLPRRVKILDAITILENNPLSGEKMLGKLRGKRKLRIIKPQIKLTSYH
jgi:mRNA-degrading endonuclease RelE of RelBE toxin-antitoxin system